MPISILYGRCRKLSRAHYYVHAWARKMPYGIPTPEHYERLNVLINSLVCKHCEHCESGNVLVWSRRPTMTCGHVCWAFHWALGTLHTTNAAAATAAQTCRPAGVCIIMRPALDTALRYTSTAAANNAASMGWLGVCVRLQRCGLCRCSAVRDDC